MKRDDMHNRLNELSQRFHHEKPKAYNQIIEAFRKLVMVKDFEKLSVAEISQEAGISRKTFYQYFKDKNDIVEHIVYENIMQPMNHMRTLSTAFEFPSLTIMSWLYKQFYEDRSFYLKISSFTGQNSFYELMLGHTSEIVADKFSDLKVSETEKEYSIFFYASSHLTVLTKWIREGMKIPPSEMASFYEKWTIPAITNYVGESR